MELPDGAWGMQAVIDLHGCDRGALASKAVVREFFALLVKEIDMTPYGPLLLEPFGQGALYGLSAVQLIETSSITFHADEPGRRAFIDVFSCKAFDAADAARVAASCFHGAPAIVVLHRGDAFGTVRC